MNSTRNIRPRRLLRGHRIPGQRRSGALVALFALLFQTSIVLWHQPPAATGTGADYSIHVMLGHVAPAPVAAHDSHPYDEHPQDEHPSQDRDRQPVPSCPICQTLQHAGAFLPLSAFTLLVPWSFAGYLTADGGSARVEGNPVPYGARAPPFAA